MHVGGRVNSHYVIIFHKSYTLQFLLCHTWLLGDLSSQLSQSVYLNITQQNYVAV